ncbi:MAG: hypothetical protein COY98_02470 [Candidatus Yonathbacteria bacterium CG_4_10_14_0_8_um_filter_43_17]|uniref:Cell division protein FtsL n=1 Tax=Candidatus Yonathbacteria bacterium CG_4_10_14_0_8_um_filter_43_17 TaxID=1975099 RepID=A0A2M7Q5A3_9BACT|nr:MAG: hypothetical protein COY98_02470 [Candidatus Yonathbacteria bacterium CG_4_10_14_0_8_um_filter_43_17]
MITKTLALNNIERKIFWVLLVSLCVFVSFYLYSALAITLAGVDRSNINRTLSEMSDNTGALEAEYLSMTNGFTLSYAKQLGFQEKKEKFTNVPAVTFATAVDSETRVAVAR